jgi:hypothetical protein
MDVVELNAHQRRVDPAPPVGRLHTDRRHTGRGDRAAWDREPEREGAGAADHVGPVERCDTAVDLADGSLSLDVLRLGVLGERRRDRGEELVELVLADRADRDVHPRIRAGRGAGRGRS